jgi:hypothetical protein
MSIKIHMNVRPTHLRSATLIISKCMKRGWLGINPWMKIAWLHAVTLLHLCLRFIRNHFWVSRFEIKIRRSAQIILSKSKYDRILSDIFTDLARFLPSDSYKFTALWALFHIIRHGKVPFFNSIVMFDSDRASHCTGSIHDIYVPNICRNCYGSHSFFYSASLLWNELTDELKFCQSIDVFKIKLKPCIMNNAIDLVLFRVIAVRSLLVNLSMYHVVSYSFYYICITFIRFVRFVYYIRSDWLFKMSLL